MTHRLGHHNKVALILTAVVLAGTVLMVFGHQPGSAEQRSAPHEPAIVAMAVQLAPNSQAIALIDTHNQTICLYQYQPRRGQDGQLVLLAARSFRYDCQLTDYNTAAPTPETIKQWLLRDQQIRHDRAQEPRPTTAKPQETKTATPKENQSQKKN